MTELSYFGRLHKQHKERQAAMSETITCNKCGELIGYHGCAESGSDTLPSKELQPHSRLYVVSPEQWKESAIALEAEVVRLEIELRDTRRALELMAQSYFPNSPIQQAWIKETTMNAARKEQV